MLAPTRDSLLPILAPLLFGACHEDRRERTASEDTSPVEDTGPTLETDPDCDSGQLDVDGDCVPAACGTGTWGELQTDESTVYVDIMAAEGGDGSQAAPFTSIQTGLDAAGAAGGGLVAVAAGSYPETLELGRSHEEVRLVGRCSELVVVDASAGDEGSSGIFVDVKASEVEVSGVTVHGSHSVGLLVGSGTVTMQDSQVADSGYVGVVAYQAGLYATSLTMESCEVVGSTMVGVGAADSGTTVSLLETSIRDTQPDGYGQLGCGIQVYGGASLVAEVCNIEGNQAAGVIALEADTLVTLRDTTIQGTLPNEKGGGYGLEISDGASLVAETCEIAGNSADGVLAVGSGATVSLRGTCIRDTQPNLHGEGGYGVEVRYGANLSAESCLVTGNSSVGIQLEDSGTVATLRGTTIQDTLPDAGGDGGYGLQVAGGATLTAEGCEVLGNRATGAVVLGSASRATLRETTIEGTLPDEQGVGGYGIQVYGGTSLVAEDCDVSGNTAAGILVLGSGTTVELERTVIQGSVPDQVGDGGYGLHVSNGGRLEAQGCELWGNTAMGLVATALGTTVILRETTIQQTQPDPNEDLGYGIGIDSGASVTLEACQLSGNTSAAVVAMGSGTTATLRETTIAKTKRGELYTVGIGVAAQQSATVEASGLEVSSNQGTGFYLTDEGTQVLCSGCDILDNQFAGAVVVWDASLVLDDCTIAGTSEQENLGGGIGVFSEPWGGGPPSLALTDCSIQDNPIAGVWLSGEGSYQLCDNTIRGGTGWVRESLAKCGDAVYARDGVTAWDGASGLLVEGNELLDGLGAGLFLDEASASLSGNSYADNAADLVVQGADCATPPEGYEDEALDSAVLCPTYDYATCGDDFRLYFELSAPESGYGARSSRLPWPGTSQLPAAPYPPTAVWH